MATGRSRSDARKRCRVMSWADGPRPLPSGVGGEGGRLLAAPGVVRSGSRCEVVDHAKRKDDEAWVRAGPAGSLGRRSGGMCVGPVRLDAAEPLAGLRAGAAAPQ